MRLLCCADTHGRVPSAADEHAVTAWLHAGDVASGPEIDSSMLDADPRRDPLLLPVADWFVTGLLPKFAVRGNHDVLDVYRAFADGRDASGRLIELHHSVWLAGIGWHGERHYELPLEADLRKVVDGLDRQMMRLVFPGSMLVLLTHYPPLLDDRIREREDSPAIRALIDRWQPAVVIEGHVHRRAGEVRVISHPNGRRTTVVNPGPHGMLIDVYSPDDVAVTPSCLPPRPGSARP